MNVDILSGTPPSIGLFFAVASGILFLTILISIGYKPVMLRLRQLISFYKRRIGFHRLLQRMKKDANQFRTEKWQEEYAQRLANGMKDKAFSSQVMTNIVEKYHAMSRLQQRLDDVGAEVPVGNNRDQTAQA
jgi:hypothetical protein